MDGSNINEALIMKQLIRKDQELVYLWREKPNSSSMIVGNVYVLHMKSLSDCWDCVNWKVSWKDHSILLHRGRQRAVTSLSPNVLTAACIH